jgi:hypothetical protein
MISGKSSCNYARLRAQHCLYSLYAFWAGGLDLPNAFLSRVQFNLAALHSVLYHGAICFSHLLGFLLVLIAFLVMTPAVTAS